MNDSQTQQVVSTYTYNQSATAQEEQLVASSADFDRMLLEIPGFHYRSLTKMDGGVWQDISYWDSQEALDAANESMQKHPAFGQFMQYIDEASVKNHKAIVVSSAYPGMS